jgi:hypothetical protein
MIQPNYTDDLFYISPFKSKVLNFFWLGFSIYTLSYVLSTSGRVSYIACQLVQIIGLLIFLPSMVFLIRLKIKNYYLALMFFLYYAWLIGVVFRGITFDYESLKRMFFDGDYGLLIYLAPLLVLFPANLHFYKKLFDIIIVFGIAFLFYDALFFRDLLDRTPDTQETIEHFAKSLSLPCGFIVLTYWYHSDRRKLIAVGVLVLTLLLSIYKARRGLSLITFSTLLFAYLLYLTSTKRKILVIYLSLVAMVAAGFYMANTYNMGKNNLFSLIKERGEEDTRSGVEVYFYDDMKQNDWIAGKGINGEYFCPDIDEGQLTDYRNIIETGFLQIILKGGIISLALYLLIALPAILIGLLFSKNTLSKAAAIWIFISLIGSYPAITNTFSLNYLMVWISIGICYSTQIRNLSNETLREFFLNPEGFNDEMELQAW